MAPYCLTLWPASLLSWNPLRKRVAQNQSFAWNSLWLSSLASYKLRSGRRQVSARRSLVWESPIETLNASWMATALKPVGGIVSVQWWKVSSRGLGLRWRRLLNCMSSRSRESPHPKQGLLCFSIAQTRNEEPGSQQLKSVTHACI